VASSLPGCSVIIIAYNSGGLLPSCLHSINKALAGMDHQVVVFDNGSPESLGEDLPKHFPSVEFVFSKENLGFGKGCNAAAARAKHPYLFFVNPDTLVSEDTFRSTLEYMLSRPDAGIVGCRILNGDGSLQWACRRSFPSPMAAVYKTLGLAALFPRSRRFAAYNLTYLDPEQDAEVDAISGSFFCVARDTFEKVGGFDESFFMYGEDLDICYRVQQAGFRNYYFPGTSIVHFKGQSSKTRAFRSYVNFYQAMLVFVNKHRYYRPFPKPLVAGGILLAALLGVFSRLLPRWWKMLLDLGGFCALWVLLASDISLWPVPPALLLLGLAAWLPLLALGEYSTHRLDSRDLAKYLLPAQAGAAVIGHLSGTGPFVYLVATLGAFSMLFWRRAYYWGHYFFRVFTGRRTRAVLLGASPEADRWFGDERALPGCELLGCVSAKGDLPPIRRAHLLGKPSDLLQIRSRTGFRDLLVVPDSHGFHEPVDAHALLENLKIRTRLLIGHPDTSTFILVDLNYLK